MPRSDHHTKIDTTNLPAAAGRGGNAATWARGGTKAMTARDLYPDPFAGDAPGCELIGEQGAGPCTATTIERQDISEGYPGLPMRLALRIVDADLCLPMDGARVEIWHTQRSGVYSGETPMLMCSRGDPEAREQLYFRGTQRTGADGRVDFDTCFPGWYPGRTVHVHVRVFVGTALYATSQLYFDPALTIDIFTNHPEYAEFGIPQVTNADDDIFRSASDPGSLVLRTERMPDGALLASKVIGVRSPFAQRDAAA